MNETLFGTDGIRKRVGTYPLTHEIVPRIGYALGVWAQHKYGNHPHILIAHDTRISADLIKAQLKSGLLHHDLILHDAQVLPTPALHKLVQNSALFSCGIMISASHNPYYDNGIKIVTAQGKLTEEDELFISNFITQSKVEPSYKTFGKDLCYPTAAQDYLTLLTPHFFANFLRNIHVVLDTANGALSTLAPACFEQFGARVTTINNSPNGTNINHACGAVHPAAVQQAVVAQKADIGFAFDGDGDRIIAVTKDGILKDGDALVALLSDHPQYQDQATVVGTVMANQGLEQFLRTKGKQLERTPVGDKHIAQVLTHQKLLLGGEPSGHILLNDFLSSSDALFTALRIMQVMLHTDNKELSTFAPFPQALINLSVKHKKELTSEPCASIIAATQLQLPHGRLLVRYSGTENLLRILVEDADASLTQKISSDLARKLEQALS